MESTFSNKQVLFVDFQTKKRIVPLWVERREERSTCMKVCSSIVHSQSGSGSRTGSFTGPLKGLSPVRGNSYAGFLGGLGLATAPGYPTGYSARVRYQEETAYHPDVSTSVRANCSLNRPRRFAKKARSRWRRLIYSRSLVYLRR